MKGLKRFSIGMLFMLVISGTSGCVGTVISLTTDAAIEIAKVPFKIGGAVADVISDDDDDDEEE